MKSKRKSESIKPPSYKFSILDTRQIIRDFEEAVKEETERQKQKEIDMESPDGNIERFGKRTNKKTVILYRDDNE